MIPTERENEDAVFEALMCEDDAEREARLRKIAGKRNEARIQYGYDRDDGKVGMK